MAQRASPCVVLRGGSLPREPAPASRPGTYESSCSPDVNECRRPGDRRACQHACHNTPGSYLCSCRPGYRLSGDRVSCEGNWRLPLPGRVSRTPRACSLSDARSFPSRLPQVHPGALTHPAVPAASPHARPAPSRPWGTPPGPQGLSLFPSPRRTSGHPTSPLLAHHRVPSHRAVPRRGGSPRYGRASPSLLVPGGPPGAGHSLDGAGVPELCLPGKRPLSPCRCSPCQLAVALSCACPHREDECSARPSAAPCLAPTRCPPRPGAAAPAAQVSPGSPQPCAPARAPPSTLLWFAGCLHEGVARAEGDVFSLSDGNCTVCVCLVSPRRPAGRWEWAPAPISHGTGGMPRAGLCRHRLPLLGRWHSARGGSSGAVGQGPKWELQVGTGGGRFGSVTPRQVPVVLSVRKTKPFSPLGSGSQKLSPWWCPSLPGPAGVMTAVRGADACLPMTSPGSAPLRRLETSPASPPSAPRALAPAPRRPTAAPASQVGPPGSGGRGAVGGIAGDGVVARQDRALLPLPALPSAPLSSPAKCSFRGRTYVHGARFSLDEDDCTTCVCRVGLGIPQQPAGGPGLPLLSRGAEGRCGRDGWPRHGAGA